MRGYLLSIAELLSETEGASGEEKLYGKEAFLLEKRPDRFCGQEESDRLLAQAFAGKDGRRQEKEESSGLLARAFAGVDSHRREKAARMKPGKGQAASLGAGLLLRLAVAEAAEKNPGPETVCWKRYGIRELLDRLASCPVIPLRYTYGKNGKPYLKDSPFYFSLSHSGEYVLCVLAGEEVGADLQQHRSCDTEKLARRFFSEREKEALGQAFRSGAGQEEYFRLWVRKEAYGKLTGEGLIGAVGRNLLPGEEALPEGKGLIWERTPEITGYSMAVCRYRDGRSENLKIECSPGV